MDSFDSKLARYLRIERGQETYGEDSPLEQSIAFYVDHLLDETVARALSNGGRRPKEAVGLLISLSGFSPLTTILTYEILRPRRLLILSSSDAVDSINVINKHLYERRGMRYSDANYVTCNPTDPLGIYRVVKNELDKMCGPDAEPPYAVIDITGGRKVMSAAAALAAWQLQLDLCYIDSTYDPATRRAVPGSDRLLLLDNPTSLFGEQEMHAALQTFNSGAFAEAGRRYGELASSIAEPGRARLMKVTADLYRAWCDLDLTALATCIEAAEATLDQSRGLLSDHSVKQLEGQFDFLRKLHHGDRQALLICFYVLGVHYREVGRHDFAALLFYRTIEGCLAHRLESLAAGFTCDAPDYTLLTPDPASLGVACQAVLRSIGRSGADASLPPVIGLIWAAVLLTALDDQLVVKAGLKGAKALSHLDRLIRARNKSVLAHGELPVSGEQSKEFQAKAQLVLRAFWRLNGPGDRVDELCDSLRFIRTDH
ncbi:TIGR02710 family CRISPR-associated CARF protein [Nonomuraea jabiensis]|uniref:TIGR02710 family CRISPR-associated CARF protein n=1 Tax=Nonomuraea jabiensis TaxID=882448 RepID=UPI0036CA4D3D